MKKIVKIQSVSDIITNSSSEVFIMENSLARSLENDYNSECISVSEIYYDTLLQNSWNYEIYTELLVKLGIVTWAECNYDSNWRAYTENREKFLNIVTSMKKKLVKHCRKINMRGWILKTILQIGNTRQMMHILIAQQAKVDINS